MRRKNLLKRTMAIGIAAAMAAGMVGCSRDAAETTAAETVAETVAETEVPASLTVDQTVLEVRYGTTVVFTDGSSEDLTEAETTAEETVVETTAEEETEAPTEETAEETEAETEGKTEAERVLEPVTVQVTAEGIDSWEVTVAEASAEEDTTAAETETETAEPAATVEETETEAETEEETQAAEPVQAYEINGTEVTFLLPGVYEVTISGGDLTATVEVTAIDDVAPVITAPESLEVEVDDTGFDFLAEVSAVDEIDGDLTDMIEVNTENAVLDEAGETSVVYTVKDAAGNVAEVEVPVTVVEASGGNNSGSGFGTSSGNDGNTATTEPSTEPAGQTGNETVDNKPNSAEEYQAYKDFFDNSMSKENWDLYLMAMDEEMREAMNEEDYNRLRAYLEAGIAEVNGSGGGSTENQGEYLDGSAIVDMINNARAEAGLGSVSWDESLTDLGRTRAKELATSFSHQRPDGTYIEQYNHMGECIGKGYRSVQEVFDGWMASQGHKDAILYASHTSCYLAGYKDAGGTNYWVLIMQ